MNDIERDCHQNMDLVVSPLELCLQPNVYLTVTALLISSLVALAFALCTSLRQRSKDGKVQRLLSVSLFQNTF